LFQVEEMQRSDWLICQSASKFVARQVVSLMKNEQQSQNLLHKVDPRSTFRNTFLQSATNVFTQLFSEFLMPKILRTDVKLPGHLTVRMPLHSLVFVSFGFLRLPVLSIFLSTRCIDSLPGKKSILMKSNEQEKYSVINPSPLFF